MSIQIVHEIVDLYLSLSPVDRTVVLQLLDLEDEDDLVKDFNLTDFEFPPLVVPDETELWKVRLLADK